MCFMETNSLFGKYAKVQLYVFPAVFVFCKMNMFLISSLANLIIDSASRWVGGWWVGGRLVDGSVVRQFDKTLEKSVFGVVISSEHFGGGLCCRSNFNVFQC